MMLGWKRKNGFDLKRAAARFYEEFPECAGNTYIFTDYDAAPEEKIRGISEFIVKKFNLPKYKLKRLSERIAAWTQDEVANNRVLSNPSHDPASFVFIVFPGSRGSFARHHIKKRHQFQDYFGVSIYQKTGMADFVTEAQRFSFHHESAHVILRQINNEEWKPLDSYDQDKKRMVETVADIYAAIRCIQDGSTEAVASMALWRALCIDMLPRDYIHQTNFALARFFQEQDLNALNSLSPKESFDMALRFAHDNFIPVENMYSLSNSFSIVSAEPRSVRGACFMLRLARNTLQADDPATRQHLRIQFRQFAQSATFTGAQQRVVAQIAEKLEMSDSAGIETISQKLHSRTGRLALRLSLA